MAERDEVILTIEGRQHRGWSELSIDLSIDNLAHGFSLSVSERWTEDDGSESAAWTIEAGKACTVAIGGETVIDGWIDAVEPSVDSENHAIVISGRSKAADLLDCSAVNKPGSWSNRKLEDIAADLVKPFGLSVSAKTATGAAFAKFAIQPGETVFEALERMTKMRGLLMVSNAAGNIELVTPKPAGAAVKLVLGEHLRSISAKHDASQRFSQYLVKGQSAGNDQHHGKSVSQPSGDAVDGAVKRYRPLMIVADDQASLATAKTRAAWEASVRAAKGQSAEAVVSGWRDPDDNLWQVMRLVEVTAPAVFIEGQMMVAAVSFRKSADDATVTTLSLAYPQAYTPEPIEAEASVAKIRKKGRK